MTVEMSDFQRRLTAMSLNLFLGTLPMPPANHPANPMDNTVDLVRSEAQLLLAALDKPVDQTPRNTFKTNA